MLLEAKVGNMVLVQLFIVSYVLVAYEKTTLLLDCAINLGVLQAIPWFFFGFSISLGLLLDRSTCTINFVIVNLDYFKLD